MIPKTGKYLINFWRDGRVFASVKIDAPTKRLAWLNMVFDQPEHLRHKLSADRITISRMKSVPKSVIS